MEKIKILDGWEEVELSELFNIQRGFSYRGEQLSKGSTNKRLITINNYQKEGGLKTGAENIYLKENFDIEDYFIAKEGDLLIANTDMSKGLIIGAPILIDGDLSNNIFSMDLTKLVPKKKINLKFMYYLISSKMFRDIMKSGAQGTNVLHLNHDILRKVKIIIPKLILEQDAISIILSTNEEIIQKIKEEIKIVEKIKRGLIKYYFLNTDWKSKKIEDICQVKTGGTPFTKNKGFWGGEIKWMSSGEIHNKFVYDTEKKITQKGLENSNAEILPINSIMIALNGQGKTRGTVAILKVETSCNQSLACLIPNDKGVHYEYLYYNLQSRYNEIRNITGQKGREGLNLKTIKNIEIPIPHLENSEKSLNEQIKISSNLLLADKKIEILNTKKAILERIKKGLMNDLLTGKKRVNVENVLKIGK